MGEYYTGRVAGRRRGEREGIAGDRSQTTGRVVAGEERGGEIGVAGE